MSKSSRLSFQSWLLKTLFGMVTDINVQDVKMEKQITEGADTRVASVMHPGMYVCLGDRPDWTRDTLTPTPVTGGLLGR